MSFQLLFYDLWKTYIEYASKDYLKAFLLLLFNKKKYW